MFDGSIRHLENETNHSCSFPSCIPGWLTLLCMTHFPRLLQWKSSLFLASGQAVVHPRTPTPGSKDSTTSSSAGCSDTMYRDYPAQHLLNGAEPRSDLPLQIRRPCMQQIRRVKDKNPRESETASAVIDI